MIPDDFVERIQKYGYWRVNIRPRDDYPEKITLAKCREVVDRSRVEIRGWDYPHFQRNKDNGGDANVGEYYENWCEWERHFEFWRMYRSTQFLHYRVLCEDLNNGGNNRPDGKALSVLSAIYTITEIIEFASRMYQNDMYKSGINLSISIMNTKGRQLWISQWDRMPFFEEKYTYANSGTYIRV